MESLIFWICESISALAFTISSNSIFICGNLLLICSSLLFDADIAVLSISYCSIAELISASRVALA